MSSYNDYINDYYTSIDNHDVYTYNNIVLTGATINQELGAVFNHSESNYLLGVIFSPSYRVIDVRSNNAMVTIGGLNKSDSNYEYNVRYTGTNVQDSVNVIKYDNNGYLNFTAHTGGAIQGTNADVADSIIKDSNISIKGSNTWNYYSTSALPVSYSVNPNQDVSINGVTANKLTLISDMSANFDIDSTISAIYGYKTATKGSDGKIEYSYTELGSSNTAVAAAFNVASIDFKNNFTGTLDIAGKITAKGYITPVINANTVGAYGVKSSGDVTLFNGYWGGEIIASASGNEFQGDKDLCLDTDKTVLKSASVSDNKVSAAAVDAASVNVKDFTGNFNVKTDKNKFQADATGNTVEVTEKDGVVTRTEKVEASDANVAGNAVTAIGFNASGAIAFEDFSGSIAVSANENKFEATASSKQVSTGGGESGSTTQPTPTNCSVTISNNTITVYGIKSESALTVNDFGGSVSASANDTSFTAKGTSDEGTVTITGNTITVSAIEVAGLTVRNDFTATVTATIYDIAASQSGDKSLSTLSPINNNKTSLIGMNITGDLNVNGDMVGIISANASDWSGSFVTEAVTYYNEYDVIALQADSINIDGYWNSTISTTSDNVFEVGALGISIDTTETIGVKADAVTAKAFTGTVSSNVGMVIFHEMNSTDDDVFDITGDVNGNRFGVQGFYNGMSLRVSGSIKVEELFYEYAPQYGYRSYAIIAGIYEPNYGKPSFTGQNDFLEIAAGAEIFGNIDLTNGENTVIIDSNARVTGGLNASGGKVNLTFMLNDKAMGDAANATSQRNTVWTIDQEAQQLDSTASVAINLNDVILEDGVSKTYYLANDSFSNWNDRQIAFVYQNIMKWTKVGETVTVDGAFNVSSKYENGVLSVTVNELVDAGEKFAALSNVNGELDVINGELAISWDKVVADKFEIEYSIDGGKTITVMVDGALNSFVLDGIRDGQKVDYRVRAHFTEYRSFSDWSEVKSFTCEQEEVEVDSSELISAEDFSFNIANTEIHTLTSSSVVTLSWNGFVCQEGLKHYEVRYYLSEVECNNLDWDSLKYGADDHYYHKYTTADELIITGLNDSEYLYWQIRCVDNKGNVSAWQDVDALKMVADVINPEMHEVTEMVTYDATHTKNPDEIGFITASLKWDPATDNDGGAGVRDYTIKYRAVGETEWTEVVLTNETFEFSVELANGHYEWQIYATDYAQNQSAITSGEWKGDHTAPVSVSEITYQTVYNTGNDPLDLNVTIYWDPAEDYDDSERPGSMVKEYVVYRRVVGEEEWTLMETIASVDGQTDPYSYAIENTGNFDYEWKVVAVDYALNEKVDWQGISYGDHVAPDMAGEVLYKTTYLTDDEATTPCNITVTLNWDAASDRDCADLSGSGIKGYYISYAEQGSDEWTLVGTVGNSETEFSYTMANGDYQWKVQAFDYALNVSTGLLVDSWGDHVAPDMAGEVLYKTTYLTDDAATDPCDITVTLNWDAASDRDCADLPGSGVKGYYISYAEQGSDEWTLVGTVGNSVTEFSYTMANGDYQWKVQAFDYALNVSTGLLVDSWGDHVAPDMAGEVLYKTTYLTDDEATTPCDITVTLNWDAASDRDCADLPGSGIKGYYISYAEQGSDEWTLVGTVGNSTTEFSYTMANGDYHWKVQAFDYALNVSTGLLVDSWGDHVAPDMAGDLSAETEYICIVGQKEPCEINVTLNWSAASDLDCASLDGSGVRGYVISCRVSEDAEWSIVGNVSADVNTFTTKLANGDYQWKVQAYDYALNLSVGEQVWSYGDLGDIRENDKPVMSGIINVDSFEYKRETWSSADPKTSCKIDLSVSWDKASDAKSGVKEYNIYYRELDGEWIAVTTLPVATVTGENGKCFYTYAGLLSADTDYELKIEAVDYANNVVSENKAIVGSHKGDSTAPDFSSNKTKWVALWNDVDKNFVISGLWSEASDGESGLAGYLISYRDTRNGKTGSQWFDAGTTEATFAIENGDYEWTVEAIDYAGNATMIQGESSEKWRGDVLPPLFDEENYSFAGKVNKNSDGVSFDIEWAVAHEQEGLNKTGFSHYVLTIIGDLDGDGSHEAIYTKTLNGQFNTSVTVTAAECGIDPTKEAFYGWYVEAYDFGGNKTTVPSDSALALVIDNTPPVGEFGDTDSTKMECSWATRVENADDPDKAETVSYISNITITCDWDDTTFADAMSAVFYEVQICESDTFFGDTLKSFYTDDTSIAFDSGSWLKSEDWKVYSDNLSNSVNKETFNAGELLGMNQFYWRVRAVDNLGNASDIWYLGNEGEAFSLFDQNHLDEYGAATRIYDNTAPVVAGSASIYAEGDGGAHITWTPAMDAFGVKEYRVQLTRTEAFDADVNITEYNNLLTAFNNVASITKTNSKTYTIITDNDWNSVKLNGLPDGVYSISVKAYDYKGFGSENVKLASKIVVDTTAPVLDLQAVTSKVAVNDVNFSWKTAYDVIGVDHYELGYKKFDENGGFEWVQYVTIDGKATSFQLNNLEVGKYCFSLQAFDAAGHASNIFGWVYEETNVTDESIFEIGSVDAGNSMSTAQAMIVGKVYEDAVNYNDTKDYYSLQLTGASEISITLGDVQTLGGSKGGVTLELFDASGKRVKKEKLASGTKNYSYTLDAGKYYFCVSPAKGNTSVVYTIKGEVDKFPAITPNDGNDNFKQGQLKASAMLDSGVTGSLTIDGWVGYKDGEDYLAVTATDSAYTTIKVSGITAQATVVLYDANKKKITSLKMTGDGTLFEGYLGSNYYISVTSGDKGKGKYNTEYSFDINAAYVRKDVVANNTMGDAANNAQALVNGDNTLSGWVGIGDVADIYKFTSDSGEALSFNVSGVTGKLKLTVYDQNYKKIKSITVAKDGNYLNDLLVDGDFYVEVASADKGKKQHSNYDITMNAEIFPVETAANNNLNSASDLATAGNGVVSAWNGVEAVVEDWVGFGDKSDYFAFDMSSEGKIDFDLTLDEDLTAGKDVKVTLYDAAGKKIALDSDMICKNDLEIGKYFVAVETSNEKKNITGYNLEISIC